MEVGLMDNEWISIGYDLRASTKGRTLSLDPLVFPWPKEIDRPSTINTPELNSLNLFRSAANALRTCTQRDEFLIICATVIYSTHEALSKRYDEYNLSDNITTQQLKTDAWFFHGYDVCDLRGLISGIHGCGEIYNIKEYAEQLNEYSLFSNAYIAREFSELRSIEIPSHAPFVTVGIYSAPKNL